ncbi:uncharacterized protein LOC108482400 [Gossypium arboreum]|uniref:uncharacterized protein LOC108482400 n=1 Tax=Gossypium arboreum TaxID=29729 RepID=UPI0008193A9B|nr:uncharacterized protein LOC108482400 [Gossypium arboreum]
MDSVGSVESIGRHFNPLALTSQKVVVLVDENTFLAWKQHVLLVLKTQCLRSFIDGTITVPPRILVDADGSSVENSAYIQYEQQDSNLAAWLLSIGSNISLIHCPVVGNKCQWKSNNQRLSMDSPLSLIMRFLSSQQLRCRLIYRTSLQCCWTKGCANFG